MLLWPDYIEVLWEHIVVSDLGNKNGLGGLLSLLFKPLSSETDFSLEPTAPCFL